MKKLLIGLLTLGSISAFAAPDCYLNTTEGQHIDLVLNEKLFDSGAPFGLVRIEKANGRYHFSSIVNGEETIVSFKKELSLTKQTPKGISVDGNSALGNVVCK